MIAAPLSPLVVPEAPLTPQQSRPMHWNFLRLHCKTGCTKSHCIATNVEWHRTLSGWSSVQILVGEDTLCGVKATALYCTLCYTEEIHSVTVSVYYTVRITVVSKWLQYTLCNTVSQCVSQCTAVMSKRGKEFFSRLLIFASLGSFLGHHHHHRNQNRNRHHRQNCHRGQRCGLFREADWVTPHVGVRNSHELRVETDSLHISVHLDILCNAFVFSHATVFDAYCWFTLILPYVESGRWFNVKCANVQMYKYANKQMCK